LVDVDSQVEPFFEQNRLLMFTNQKPLAAATSGSIHLRMSPDVRSLGGSSSANIN
jgi:hypothetical protein